MREYFGLMIKKLNIIPKIDKLNSANHTNMTINFSKN